MLVLSGATLTGLRGLVFSKRAGPRAGIRLEDAGRNPRPGGRGRVGGAIRRRREAVRPAEARREGADAAQPDGEADLRHRAVCVAQQLGGTFEPPGEEVLVRRLAERPLELAAEMGGGDVRRARERGHVERLAVAGIDQVLRAQEVPGRVNGSHRAEYRGLRSLTSGSLVRGIFLKVCVSPPSGGGAVA